jgi:hypothetical protein
VLSYRTDRPNVFWLLSMVPRGTAPSAPPLTIAVGDQTVFYYYFILF